MADIATINGKSISGISKFNGVNKSGVVYFSALNGINVPASVDVEITGIGNVANGIEYDRMNVSVNFTNSGGAGNATVYWEIRDSSNNLVDSGNQTISFASGSGSRSLTGLSYPAAGNGYTIRAKETDDASYEVSNSFNVSS